MSAIPVADNWGLRIARENKDREMLSTARWNDLYGSGAQDRKKTAQEFENLGLFERMSATPMPLAQQLLATQESRRTLAADYKREKQRQSDYNAATAHSSYESYKMPHTYPRFDVQRTDYSLLAVAPHHNYMRKVAAMAAAEQAAETDYEFE